MPDESDELLNTFLDEADEHLQALEQGLMRVDEETPDLELLNGMFRAAHSIKGGSGVFGFEAITRLTHALEQLLDRIRKGIVSPSRDRIDLLLWSVDGLRVLLNFVREGSPEADILPTDTIRSLYELAGIEQQATVVPVVKAPVPTGPRIYRVDVNPGPELLSNGLDPQLLLRNLGKRGEVLSIAANLTAIPLLEVIEPNLCYLSWVLTIRTERDPDDLKAIFQFVEDDCAVEVTEDESGVGCANRAPTVSELLEEYEAAYRQLIAWATTHLPLLQQTRVA